MNSLPYLTSPHHTAPNLTLPYPTKPHHNEYEKDRRKRNILNFGG